MAVGVLFIALTPGYSVDLMSYLFGNIPMVSHTDLLAMTILHAVVAGLVTLLYKQFLAVCFDEEFARIRGVNVSAFYLLLLFMVAVTVVSLIQVVGLILVIALFTLPAAPARQYTGLMVGMMVGACMLGAVFGVAGMAASAHTNCLRGQRSFCSLASLISFHWG